MRPMPPGVRIILIVTIASFLLQISVGDGMAGEGMIGSFALWPLQGDFMPWQLVTYAFLHSSFMHIAFNMYGLWLVGSELEYALGSRRFLIIYFASILSAALTQLLVMSLTGGVYPTVGASGGVFGLLLAYGIFFPNRIVMLLIPPIPMRAWRFVFIYAVIELILGVTGTQAGVAHFAHLGGMIGAYMVIRSGRGAV
ncbi:MAG: rhomboid family intramembrane serine protease [Gallionella sp.]